MGQGKENQLVIYSEEEELVNRLTHGLGAVLGVAGMVFLLWRATAQGDPWRLTSCAIYGSTLVLFYTISTLYHSLRRPKLRNLFRILDHVSIFFIIAGTYTPFTLITLRGAWGWTLFGIVWGMALVGAVFKAFMVHRLRMLAPMFYLAMGWLIVIAIRPLLDALPWNGFLWLLCGGVAYTLGVVFYAWQKIPYNHAIWHLFVLGGSISHYLAIYYYVVPV